MFNKIDGFTKNVILVFLGTSLSNLFNLIYQILIAHRLSPVDFAAFNSLLALYMMVSSPLGTLYPAVVKYTAQFNAQNETGKIRLLLSGLLKRTSVIALLTLIIFYFISCFIMDKLKIGSAASVYILAISLSLSCITPVLSGGVQGLESFKWLTSISIISGAVKLILAFLFIGLGFNIAGALGAFLAAILITLALSYIPLRNFLTFGIVKDGVNFKELFFYLFPVAITYFCFIALVSFDMVLVKYFFKPEESGVYSLAQMVGKVLLFLPGAISIVMFPRTSGLHAKNIDTIPTLIRAILYAAVLCGIVAIGYNIFPVFFLKMLTGKTNPEAIMLGRLFSVSMSFFALLFVLLAYFLSKKELRFIKYLVISTLLQFIAITLFHGNLIQVQLVLCINAILLFFIHLLLVYRQGLSPCPAIGGAEGTVPVIE